MKNELLILFGGLDFMNMKNRNPRHELEMKDSKKYN